MLSDIIFKTTHCHAACLNLNLNKAFIQNKEISIFINGGHIG